MTSNNIGYDPRTFRQLTYFESVPKFLDGSDSPRAYLERCLAEIDKREPAVKGWVSLRADGAREDADASAARYKNRTPLSPIDGMPVGVKDLISTKDLPTTLGLPDYETQARIDTATIQGLKAAGAVILGKVTTTPLGNLSNSPTTNPFDEGRTPGGSSSGSGAVVGARMVPVSIGSQVAGSGIRPASYSGNFALKPTVGGFHRGDRLSYSHAVHTIHAGSFEDVWQTTAALSRLSGGDPGYPGVYATPVVPAPVKPRRIIVIETQGWATAEERTRNAFEEFVGTLGREQVQIIRRADSPLVNYFEESISDAYALTLGIMAFETRWDIENIFASVRDKLPASYERNLERARSLSTEDYRLLLLKRDEARLRLKAIGPMADALLTLSAPGPAPLFVPPDQPDSRVPYGTPGSASFNVAASMLGAPCINIPMMAVDRMPVGLQLIGQHNGDENLVAIGRWMHETLPPVVL